MIKSENIEKLDVDVRFLLANERTLLAWIRTSLAIQAGGIALSALHSHHPLFGVLVLLLGISATLVGYHRYKVADKSIRAGHMPPSSMSATLQVYAIVAIAIILALAQITIFH